VNPIHASQNCNYEETSALIKELEKVDEAMEKNEKERDK